MAKKIKKKSKKSPAKAKSAPVRKKKTAKAPKASPKKKAVTKRVAGKKRRKEKEPSSREKKIALIKQSLLTKKNNLLKEAETALNSLPGEINFPDMGDQATAEADRDFMLRLRERERMLLKKIDEAIDRIDRGNFGICENCGGEIGIKRLEARPVTTYCIDCKIRQEEEEKIAEGG